MRTLKSMVLAVLFFGVSEVGWAFPYGQIDYGVVTPDKQYIFPNCGDLNLSKKTALAGCAVGFDFYEVSTLTKIMTFPLGDLLESYVRGPTETMFPYHYSDGLVVLSSSNLISWFEQGETEEVEKNKKVILVASDLREAVRHPDPNKYAEGIKFEVDDVNACWQVFAWARSVIAICADADNIYYVERSAVAQTMTPFMKAADIGVAKAYFAVPTFTFDERALRLVNDRDQEYLGGDRYTFPKGYFDLKTKTYILE